MTKGDDNGNGHSKRNIAKMMIPITAVGAFISFGVGAGMYVRGLEAGKLITDNRVTELERRLSELASDMLGKERFGWWVESFKRDPTKVPEAPR